MTLPSRQPPWKRNPERKSLDARATQKARLPGKRGAYLMGNVIPVRGRPCGSARGLFPLHHSCSTKFRRRAPIHERQAPEIAIALAARLAAGGLAPGPRLL